MIRCVHCSLHISMCERGIRVRNNANAAYVKCMMYLFVDMWEWEWHCFKLCNLSCTVEIPNSRSAIEMDMNMSKWMETCHCETDNKQSCDGCSIAVHTFIHIILTWSKIHGTRYRHLVSPIRCFISPHITNQQNIQHSIQYWAQTQEIFQK